MNATGYPVEGIQVDTFNLISCHFLDQEESADGVCR